MLSSIKALFSKATKMISWVLKTASPLIIVEILIIGHYNSKKILHDPCDFNKSLLKVAEIWRRSVSDYGRVRLADVRSDYNAPTLYVISFYNRVIRRKETRARSILSAVIASSTEQLARHWGWSHEERGTN